MANKQQATPATKTHWKKHHNPNYLGAWDFAQDEQKVLTIKSVALEMVQSPDGGKEQCSVCHFKEQKVKPFILNVTNSKTITKVFGTPYIEDWAGKKIALHVEKVKAFGEIVDAVRVIPQEVKAEKPELTPEHKRWADAAKALASKDNATTIEGIRKHWSLSDKNAELLKELAITFVD